MDRIDEDLQAMGYGIHRVNRLLFDREASAMGVQNYATAGGNRGHVGEDVPRESGGSGIFCGYAGYIKGTEAEREQNGEPKGRQRAAECEEI